MLVVVATTALLWSPVKAFSPTPTFGYRRRASSSLFSHHTADEHDISTNLDPLAVREYTEEAIHFRGQPRGLTALKKLGDHCNIRTPFDFDNNNNNSMMDQKSGSVVAPQPGLIPPRVTEKFLRQVQEMEQHGWLSTNPDSVDGLPSLHLNLVSGGKPLVGGDNVDSLDDFQRGLLKLLSTVKPYIYNKLLPNVQELTNDPSIRVSDVF